MSLHPLSLLVTVAILLPNLLMLTMRPTNMEVYEKGRDNRLLAVVERVGQAASFALPVFFRLRFEGTGVVAAWIVMSVSLGFYWLGWVRYFIRGRDYWLLFAPLLGIPIPLALAPILYYLASSVVLASPYQAAASGVLAVGHLPITYAEAKRIRTDRPGHRT